jgi:HlyD family secretion protein
MRLPIKSGIAVILGVAAAVSYQPLREQWRLHNRTIYQEEPLSRGDIVFHVNSTGTMQPVLSVHIGSFASGPIDQLFVEFNQHVTKGQLLAKIDPRLYQANVLRDEAGLITKQADVERCKALLQQAVNDHKRAEALKAINKDYVSDTEMDQYRFNRLSLDAQLKVAIANVKQAEANLDNSKANLEYTEIKSPVDGIVIDRKIDPGQTLAAQFQTPEMFIVAPDMRKEMYVMASVDEADIGLIRQAQEKKNPVHFTVDAYPDDLFEGKVFQIRMNSTTTQNVVTYPVVVSCANPELKLLPGMTANLSFEIEQRSKVLRVPNSALRFYPKPELVRPEDRAILEGLAPRPDQDKEKVEISISAPEKAAASKSRNRHHVWVLDGDFLRAVEIRTGISDSKFTAVNSGELAEGDKVVTGIDTTKGGSSQSHVAVKAE